MCKRTRATSRSGATAVEFAFVAPVFFLLVFGLIEVSRMMMIQQSLTNAAREGSRTAVLATTNDSAKVEAAVRNYLRSVMSNSAAASNVRITTPDGLANCPSGTDLTVTAEVDFRDVSWLPLNYLGIDPTIGSRQVGKRE